METIMKANIAHRSICLSIRNMRESPKNIFENDNFTNFIRLGRIVCVVYVRKEK